MAVCPGVQDEDLPKSTYLACLGIKGNQRFQEQTPGGSRNGAPLTILACSAEPGGRAATEA